MTVVVLLFIKRPKSKNQRKGDHFAVNNMSFLSIMLFVVKTQKCLIMQKSFSKTFRRELTTKKRGCKHNHELNYLFKLQKKLQLSDNLWIMVIIIFYQSLFPSSISVAIMNNFLAQEVCPTLIFHLSLAYTQTELDYNPKISFLQLLVIYYHTPNFIFCNEGKKCLNQNNFPVRKEINWHRKVNGVKN